MIRTFKITENHQCNSYRDGDWIVWTCPKCPSFERRYNWRSGDTRETGLTLHIRHYGPHIDFYLESFTELN